LCHFLILISFFLVTQGAFPEIATDIVLSSDDDDVAYPPEPDAPAMPKGLANDDAGVVGTASVKTLIPGLIGTDAPNLPRPSIANWVSIVLRVRGRGSKHPPIATKWPKPVPHVDQVTTQVELPPFLELRSPLDLVANEIVFGHLFEVFRRMS
jgi:hypothetical protein